MCCSIALKCLRTFIVVLEKALNAQCLGTRELPACPSVLLHRSLSPPGTSLPQPDRDRVLYSDARGTPSCCPPSRTGIDLRRSTSKTDSNRAPAFTVYPTLLCSLVSRTLRTHLSNVGFTLLRRIFIRTPLSSSRSGPG
jgi:hypothetical protein